ncbi:hypothetical protein D3C78_1196090 [compost metagenome]
MQFGIPANNEYRPNVTEKDLTPLYILKPKRISNNPYDTVNHEIINAFKTAAQLVLDDYLKGTISIEEAFSIMEVNGQQAVDLAKEELDMN